MFDLLGDFTPVALSLIFVATVYVLYKLIETK